MRCARGSVTLVALAGILVLCTFAAAAADFGALLVARARAAAAADAAALAAIVAQVPAFAGAETPDEAARAAAEANGAEMLSCSCVRGNEAATVEVAVRARAMLIRAWDGRRARASATAAVDPDLLSYRPPG